jgi:hypothetical protein
MRTILIISPDPETGRSLELAFELAGWEVRQATTIKGSKADGADVVILDMIEGLGEFKKAVTVRSFKKAKVMALAPRGMGEEAVTEKVPRANFVVRRPYELTHLVRTAEELFGE